VTAVKSTRRRREVISGAIRLFTEFRRSAHRRTVVGMSFIQRVPRHEIVARVNAFLRDNLGESVTVAELSRIAGVSERTLRAAFHDVIGISPKQHLINQRLHAAHAALCAASPESSTVTDIAMAFGFFELGRFAGRYRQVFGEVPSHTLRHLEASPAA
jgi:transcriptional regulator GlxA family with amidase domain